MSDEGYTKVAGDCYVMLAKFQSSALAHDFQLFSKAQVSRDVDQMVARSDAGLRAMTESANEMRSLEVDWALHVKTHNLVP